MAPTIVLIRHAQAEHNAREDYSIRDPGLTDVGIGQCDALRASLRSRFESTSESVAVVVSPMRRTLQTATLALDWLTKRGVAFEANADWQENSAKECDTGSPVASMAPLFGNVDFSRVDPIWPDKTSPQARRYHASRGAILTRGANAIEDLRRRPEGLIFVVSHSGFLRSGVSGWWFFNADYRIFDFAVDPPSDDVNPQERSARAKSSGLVQDPTTFSGGLGLSFPDPVELGSGLTDGDGVVEQS